MDIPFPTEIEEKMAQAAARRGLSPEELVQDVVSQFLKEPRLGTEFCRRGRALMVTQSQPTAKNQLRYDRAPEAS